jgi:hypothetical protein
VSTRHPDVPDLLAVTGPEEILACARRHGILGDNEALAGEPLLMAGQVASYEGSRAALEQALAQAGGSPPRWGWRGDCLEVTASRFSRSPEGAPIVGLAVVSLSFAGPPTVTREEQYTLPGRLRRVTSTVLGKIS